MRQAGDIMAAAYRVFVETDAMLVEINPLIVTPDGVRALDSTVDDNALFRHPDMAETAATWTALPPEERMARERGVHLGPEPDGYVGILERLLVGHADASTSSREPVESPQLPHVGGGARSDEIVTAMEVALGPNVRAARLRLTRCDEERHPNGARPARRQGADGGAPRRHERRRRPAAPGRCRAPNV